MATVATHLRTADLDRHAHIGPPADLRIDPRVDPHAWVMNNERISNEADMEAWLALYAPDAVFESITDSTYERRVGVAQIEHSLLVLATALRRHRLRVKKRFVCATGDVVVNAWTGGFNGRTGQRGVEIWTLRDGLVTHHEMYTYLDVRPRTSLYARLRALVSGEFRVLWSIQRAAARAAKGGQ